MCPARVGEYRELPGPKAREWLERADEVAVTSVQNNLIVFDHARHWHDLMMRDVDGNYYMDYFCGAGVNNLGHAPEDILQAISRQRNLGATCYDESVFPSPIAISLRERLAALAPGEQSRKVFFSNSGTEAVEAAIKMLKNKRPAKRRFIAFDGAFHGRTHGSLALNGSREVHTNYFLDGHRVHHFPFPSYRGALDHLFSQAGTGALPFREINAVFLEIVQGEGGINVADQDEIKRLERWCRAHDICLVVDEVQTGIGRTGKFFASEHYGLNPDIIILAKALTNGAIPCGATIANASLDFRMQGQHANTFGGHYLAMAAAHAVLDRFENENSPLQNVCDRGDYLQRRLREFSMVFGNHSGREDSISMSNPRGLGLMVAIDLIDENARDEWGGFTPEASAPRDRVVEEAWRRGLILEGTGTQGIRFLPPLIVNRGQIDIMMGIFEEAVEAAFDINITYTPAQM